MNLRHAHLIMAVICLRYLSLDKYISHYLFVGCVLYHQFVNEDVMGIHDTLFFSFGPGQTQSSPLGIEMKGALEDKNKVSKEYI